MYRSRSLITSPLAPSSSGHRHASSARDKWEGISKNRHCEGSCVNLVLKISPNCRQGGGCLKVQKLCRRHMCTVPSLLSADLACGVWLLRKLHSCGVKFLELIIHFRSLGDEVAATRIINSGSPTYFGLLRPPQRQLGWAKGFYQDA